MTTSDNSHKLLVRLRIALWALVAVAAIGLVAVYVLRPFDALRGPLAVATADGEPHPYAPFALDSATGGTFTQADLVGTPTLVFFGYTSCPDVCPTTLAETQLWRSTLGLSPDDLRIVFVSVDPGRDTLPSIASYLSAFGAGIIGLTGTPAALDTAKASFGARSEIVGDPATDPYYVVNHTASVFLVDARGEFFGTISYEESKDVALAKLRRLVGDN